MKQYVFVSEAADNLKYDQKFVQSEPFKDFMIFSLVLKSNHVKDVLSLSAVQDGDML